MSNKKIMVDKFVIRMSYYKDVYNEFANTTLSNEPDKIVGKEVFVMVDDKKVAIPALRDAFERMLMRLFNEDYEPPITHPETLEVEDENN